ncbi:MAG: PPK2 family polyphosphate kinase [Bacteroidota bacterium]
MKIKLADVSASPPETLDKGEIKDQTKGFIKEIDRMQEMLFSEGKRSLLIVLQGLDASGKDGATKNVFGRLNPQGVEVASFKKPSKEELSHDFLWRIHHHTPEKGMIHIFNRSHYEDVLVTRVLGLTSDVQARKRFRHINNFEDLLEDAGTIVLKFFLHISKEKQYEKFQDRLTDPEKHWKYNKGDWDTREKWDEYMGHYEDVFENCSEIPWTVVPSDKNWYKEYVIAKKVYETLSAMNLTFPDRSAELMEDIKQYAPDVES